MMHGQNHIKFGCEIILLVPVLFKRRICPCA